MEVPVVSDKDLVGILAKRMVDAMHLSVCPGSITIHFDGDGRPRLVEVHAVGWKSESKVDSRGG